MPDSTLKEGMAGDPNSEVFLEEGIPAVTIAKLRGTRFWDFFFCLLCLMKIIEMGHDARLVSGFARGMMGRGQIIQKVKNTSGTLVWAAGSDPRADGHAAAHL